VGGIRPADRAAVAARNHEQPAADGRRTVVRGAQDAVLDGVAEGLQLRDPLAKRLAATSLVRPMMLVERPPIGELFDVLEADTPRIDPLGPIAHDPG